MAYNADATGTKYKDIAIAMGVEGVENMSQEEYRKAAVDAVAQLARDVKIPENLKEIDQAVGLRLAWIGSIKEEILNTTELTTELLQFLCAQYPGVIKERYGVGEEGDAVEILSKIAEIRGCLMKGSQVDVEKAGLLVLDDYRSLRLGQISLERPADFTETV